MSRTARVCLGAVLLLGGHIAAAQDRPPNAEQALEDARASYGPPPDTEPCSAEQEAAAISGEIVVCARRPSEEHRLRSSEDARRRYAAATMDAGDPRAPDFAGPPCDTSKAGCIGFGWVPPRAIVIDFAALPEAPPGSDADRIARGLAPLGRDNATVSGQARAEELGLPPPPASGAPLTPLGSASPAAPPAGSPTPATAPAPP